MSLEELNGRSAALGLVTPRVFALVHASREVGKTDHARGVLDAVDILTAESAHVRAMQDAERDRLKNAEEEANVAERGAIDAAGDIIGELVRELELLARDVNGTANMTAKRRKAIDNALTGARHWGSDNA